jgi:hypothetical protein
MRAAKGLRFYGDPDPLDIDLMQQSAGRYINDLNVPIELLPSRDFAADAISAADHKYFSHAMTADQQHGRTGTSMLIVQPAADPVPPLALLVAKQAPAEQLFPWAGCNSFENLRRNLTEQGYLQSIVCYKSLTTPLEAEEKLNMY